MTSALEANAARYTPAFGQMLREVRKRLGLTQEALAHEVGTSQSEISALERGAPAISVARAQDWEQALGLVVGTLSSAAASDTLLTMAFVGIATWDVQPSETPDQLRQRMLESVVRWK